MTRLRITLLTLLGLLALSATVVASASAEEVSEFLLNGETLTLTIEAEITTNSENMLLEDMGAPAKLDVLCSWDFVISSSNSRLGYYILVLDLTKEIEITEAKPLSCSVDNEAGVCEANKVTVFPIHLPWHYELLRMGVRRIWMILENEETKPGLPGYTVLCHSILGNVTDTCTGETEGETTNVTGGVELSFSENEEITPSLSCTLGGAKTGLLFGSSLIKPVSGGTLSVSG